MHLFIRDFRVSKFRNHKTKQGNTMVRIGKSKSTEDQRTELHEPSLTGQAFLLILRDHTLTSKPPTPPPQLPPPPPPPPPNPGGAQKQKLRFPEGIPLSLTLMDQLRKTLEKVEQVVFFADFSELRNQKLRDQLRLHGSYNLIQNPNFPRYSHPSMPYVCRSLL